MMGQCRLEAGRGRGPLDSCPSKVNQKLSKEFGQRVTWPYLSSQRPLTLTPKEGQKLSCEGTPVIDNEYWSRAVEGCVEEGYI